jgi:hypothetical protein
MPIAALMQDWNSMSQVRRITVLVLGVLVVAALAGMVWAVFFHKPSHKRRDPPKTAEPRERKRKRKRKRRHEHRPMNPTLAETGGLPPHRGDRPPPPP